MLGLVFAGWICEERWLIDVRCSLGKKAKKKTKTKAGPLGAAHEAFSGFLPPQLFPESSEYRLAFARPRL